LEKHLSPLRDGVLLDETIKTSNVSENKSDTTCSMAGEGRVDHQKAMSPLVSSPNPTLSPHEAWRLDASSASTVVPSPESALVIDGNDAPPHTQVSAIVLQAVSIPPKLETAQRVEPERRTRINSAVEQGVDDSSLPVHGGLCDQDHSEEVEKTIEDDVVSNVFERGEAAARSKTPLCASDTCRDLESAGTCRGEVSAENPPKSQPKRKRQRSRQALAPLKKTKSSATPSMTDVNIEGDSHAEACSELGRDIIVVESGDTASEVTAAVESFRPGNHEPGTSTSFSEEADPVASSVPTRSASRTPQTSKRSRNARSSLAWQTFGGAPSIIFSSSTEIDSKKNIMAFLRQYGGTPAKNITAATMLCVSSNSPLRKTANLILAVCLGLDMVTDKWLVDSQRKGFLLDPQKYLPSDSQREGEWKFKLDEAIARAKMQGGLTSLLTGTEVYFKA
jgi:hypothetical protein